MRVFISADMEGVTGVTHPQDVIPGRPQFERFRRFLTADVNAAIEGAAAAGATEFWSTRPTTGCATSSSTSWTNGRS